jgi:thiol:disulfide interchange protein
VTAPEAPLELQAPANILEVPTAAAAYDLSRLNVETEQGGSLSYYLLLAFAGGLILNIMPCVLPVIGLKVMSFVQQAGQSRAQALALNCWYAAGIVIVFRSWRAWRSPCKSAGAVSLAARDLTLR